MQDVYSILKVMAQIFGLFTCVIGLSTLIDNYLIRCLRVISKRMAIKKDFLNFLWSMCLSIPETINNFISCFSPKKELVGFGFGIIIGSGIFDFTFSFGLAALTSHLYHKRKIKMNFSTVFQLVIFYIFNICYVALIASQEYIRPHHLMPVIMMIPISYLIFIRSTSQLEDSDDIVSRAISHKKRQISRREKKISFYQARMNDQLDISGIIDLSILDETIIRQDNSFSQDDSIEKGVQGVSGSGSSEKLEGQMIFTINPKGVKVRDINQSQLFKIEEEYSDESSNEEEDDEELLNPSLSQDPNPQASIHNFQKNALNKTTQSALNNGEIVTQALDNQQKDTNQSADKQKQPKAIKTSSIPNTLNVLRKVFQRPWKVLFDMLIPIKKHPAFSFFMIILICFVLSSLQVELADHLIEKSNVSHNFVALTFFSWFGNMSDVLTVITATKHKEFELAFATLFSSQLLNIQIALCVPWCLKSFVEAYHGRKFTLKNSKMFDSLIAVIVVLVFTMLSLVLVRFRLSITLFVLLFTIYFGYIIFEYENI